jgi:hypothetical protein
LKLLFLASLGNEVYPGSEVGTSKREDGLVYVGDLGTETNDRESSDIIAMNYGTRTRKMKAVGCQSYLLKESTK